MTMFRTALGAVALAAGLMAASPARAAGESVPIPNFPFSFDGPFGTLDRASAQRGFQIYKEVCAACHAMRLLSYRNLRELGLTDEQVAAIAAQVTVTDGPNDEGQMSSARPARRTASAARSRTARRRVQRTMAPIRWTCRSSPRRARAAPTTSTRC
jgi:ubiquinol-cytochrome c reductase cytochrome c1 subunit